MTLKCTAGGGVRPRGGAHSGGARSGRDAFALAGGVQLADAPTLVPEAVGVMEDDVAEHEEQRESQHAEGEQVDGLRRVVGHDGIDRRHREHEHGDQVEQPLQAVLELVDVRLDATVEDEAQDEEGDRQQGVRHHHGIRWRVVEGAATLRRAQPYLQVRHERRAEQRGLSRPYKELPPPRVRGVPLDHVLHPPPHPRKRQLPAEDSSPPSRNGAASVSAAAATAAAAAAACGGIAAPPAAAPPGVAGATCGRVGLVGLRSA